MLAKGLGRAIDITQHVLLSFSYTIALGHIYSSYNNLASAASHNSYPLTNKAANLLK